MEKEKKIPIRLIDIGATSLRKEELRVYLKGLLEENPLAQEAGLLH